MASRGVGHYNTQRAPVCLRTRLATPETERYLRFRQELEVRDKREKKGCKKTC